MLGKIYRNQYSEKSLYDPQNPWMVDQKAQALADAIQEANNGDKFIQKTDIFPDVMQNQWFGANDTSNAPYSNNNLPEEDILLDSDTFYSKVFVPTFGMKLPFIMQIDKDNNSPDNFVIVRAVQNSITLRQTAPNLYQVKLKLRETW